MFDVDPFAPEPELVVIRTYQSGLEADLAKSVLEAAGIEPIIRGAGVSRHYLGLALTGSIASLGFAAISSDACRIGCKCRGQLVC